ncbi:MAG: hypothetical protein SH856_02710 [Flavobacteriales bacterium]|nr:hypothetical protein [Flavobacteriales bacterium]
MAGALADEVVMGDGTDVNFTALSSTNKRLFYHGTNGFLGVGSNFAETGGILPNYNLHLNDDGNANVYMQFTNLATGGAATDGLRIGLNQTTGTTELGSLDTDRWLDILEGNSRRMRFRDLDTWTGINGMMYADANRIMVPLTNADAPTIPGSMMQLGTIADGGIARPWQNIGTTYGGNADAMYVGLMERANPTGSTLQTDAVISWGCQEGATLNNPSADNFRIIFLEPTGMDPDSSGTVQGMEVFRIEPFVGNVGIGNYSSNSLQGPGTANYVGAKLDIDGDLRIRQVLENDTLTRVLMIDSTDHNRVYYQEISPNALNCDWTLFNNEFTDVCTIVGGTNCPDGDVGIGIGNPDAAELHIVKTPTDAQPNQRGVFLEMGSPASIANRGFEVRLSGAPTNFAFYGDAGTGALSNLGGYFYGHEGNAAYGLDARGLNGSQFTFGVRAAPLPIKVLSMDFIQRLQSMLATTHGRHG